MVVDSYESLKLQYEELERKYKKLRSLSEEVIFAPSRDRKEYRLSMLKLFLEREA